MNRTKSKSTVTIAIVGTSIFVLVLTVGTILSGLMAKKDTEKAVEAVSLLYLDGLAATEAIRALERPDAKIIPIIAMTANAFDEDVQRSLQVGMNAHLSKPVEPDRLYQTLEELIWEYDQAKKPE